MPTNPPISAPNIKVYQVQQTQTNIVASPQLNPFIVGPCNEVIKAFNSDGSLNSDARKGPYEQLPQLISQTAFPSPRDNIDEITVYPDTIRVFSSFSGNTKELPINPGTSFLVSHNYATRACMRTLAASGYAVNGLTLVLCINNPLRANNSLDIAVTFSGTNPLTHAQVAAQINAAVGKTVAYEVGPLSGDINKRVEILSDVYGALSSITVRAGGSANALLGLAILTEDRVEGSGFRGQDDNFGGDTLTPWIEWFKGAYYSNAVSTTFPVGKQFGQKYEDDTFVNGYTAPVTYGVGGIDIKVGDAFFADGIQVKSAEIMKVETSRFKLGTINPTLSVYDENGKPVSIVRDQVQITLLSDPVPFAPRYVYFVAQYLKTNGTPTAATLTGDNSGQPAEQAFIESTVAPVGPFALAGLNLKVTVTINDVEQNEVIYTFPGGTYATMAAVVTAIGSNIPGVVATNESGKLRLATTLFGKAQAISLASTSTANSTLNFSTVTNTTDIGKDVEFIDLPAVLTTFGNVFPMSFLAGDTLLIDVSTDGGLTSTTKTHTEAANITYMNIGALVTALQGDAGFVGTDFTVSNSGNELILTSVATGLLIQLIANPGSTMIGGAGIQYTASQMAHGQDEIQGKTFKFTLNDRPKIYTSVFQSNSLIDAISEINQSVGTAVAYTGGVNDDKLKLVSTLKGYASKVQIISDTTTLSSIFALGFEPSNDVAVGSGRPFPDAWLDSNFDLNIGAEILRNPVTGIPFDPALSTLYIQYTGLRKDVSPAAKSLEGLPLELSSQEDLNTFLGPVSEENPLALGIYFAMLNAPNTIIKAMGVDEVSEVYPEGTPDAYQRVIDFSTTHEIYAIAPLSQEEAVHRLFATHVSYIADPLRENAQRERCVYINPKVPTRALNTLVSSGLAAITPIATVNQLNLDVNPSTALLNAGINPALPIPYSSQLFVEFVYNNEIKRYSVANVNGVVLTLRNTFSTGQNTDGFFEIVPLDYVVSNVSWSLSIRGNELVLPSSTTPDKNKIAQTVNQYAQTFKNKRISYVYSDTVIAPLDGLSKQIPGYYACAAYAGVNAYQRPQQPVSNFLINGFTGVVGTKGYFTEEQMNVIAGGGVMILVNEKSGLPIFARHQLTTDVSSVETQEDSIRRSLDTTSLLFRARLKQFLGNRNITPDLLSEIGTLIDSIKAFLIDSVGCLRDLKVVSLKENPNRKDGIVIELSVTVYYPLNQIDLYIYY
jgi:hypothetical protein